VKELKVMFARGILSVTALALIIGTPAHSQTPSFSAASDSPSDRPVNRAVLPAYPMTNEMAWGLRAVETSTQSMQCSRYFGCLPRYLRIPIANAPDTSLFE
jgi:hypothetical protein